MKTGNGTETVYLYSAVLKLLVLIAAVIAIFTLPRISSGAETNDMIARSIIADLNYTDIKKDYLLAFSAEVDSRSFYVEEALLAVKLTGNGWRLVDAYQHPKEADVREHQWLIVTATDVARTGSEDYNHKPTQADVDKFLKDSWWKFSPDDGFHLVRAEIFYDTWKKALGYKPKYEFSRQGT